MYYIKKMMNRFPKVPRCAMSLAGCEHLVSMWGTSLLSQMDWTWCAVKGEVGPNRAATPWLRLWHTEQEHYVAS